MCKGVWGMCVGMYVRVCEGLMREVCRVCMYRGCVGIRGGCVLGKNLPFIVD